MNPCCFVETTPDDPCITPLTEALAAECRLRYGMNFGDREYGPASLYCAPQGGFLVLKQGDEAIGMGAYSPYDHDTAELSRIWTRQDRRRQGVALYMVQELERRARLAGYKQAFLTTGFRQPEAVSLCLSLGYTPLFDVNADPARYSEPPYDGHLSFVKWLVPLTAVKPGRPDTDVVSLPSR
ncbi:GNAT family N-acetyltransferase [Chimaeribacter californicus]|uniref:GNAT family N-acetyltransferase n=1 Tax=Chimaeribacter californicus TaxID=2060067 RepID=A0A2N5DV28_9GAMM|nr:GNAT family N-acetyltransferase [Chimaeribacter californicus]PLR30839.1 GNAT family N-acetyltransferase [Chimaeribacter californicus]